MSTRPEPPKYSRKTRSVLRGVALASFLYWFAAVAVHSHLSPALSSLLFSVPLVGGTLSGDYHVAASGIASMVVLMSTVFALRLEADVDGAIFDALLLGSLLTLGYEYWVWSTQDGWFYGRFTVLTGPEDFLGGGITNELVAATAAVVASFCSLRLVWVKVMKPGTARNPGSRGGAGGR